MQLRIRGIALVFGMLLLSVAAAGCASSGSSTAGLTSARVECASIQSQVDAQQAKVNHDQQQVDSAQGPAASQYASDLVNDKAQLATLQKQQKQCATPASPNAPPAAVTMPSGTTVYLPLVDTGTVTNGFSASVQTPATYDQALVGGPVKDWAGLANRVGALSWYTQGVTARSSETGFSWSDVVNKFAPATNDDTRVIQVFNWTSQQVPPAQAQADVEGLVGSDASKLPVHYINTCAVNTRGLHQDTMTDFLDCRQMVRVSLSPIVYDSSGNAIGLNPNSGVFVDCFNVWWLPKLMVFQPGTTPPQLTPPTTPSTPTTTCQQTGTCYLPPTTLPCECGAKVHQVDPNAGTGRTVTTAAGASTEPPDSVTIQAPTTQGSPLPIPPSSGATSTQLPSGTSCSNQNPCSGGPPVTPTSPPGTAAAGSSAGAGSTQPTLPGGE